MVSIEKWLSSNKDQVIKIIDLEDVKSKSDPCAQPYKSQYAARDILQNCISDLDELMNANEDDLNYLSYFIYFNLSYRLANNFISTEERYSGEEVIFKLCQKIEKIKPLSMFFNDFNSTKTDRKSSDKSTNYDNSDRHIWLLWLAGIIMRIYSACGMLWAGKIITSTTDSSIFDDLGSCNSIKYLTLAKRIYKNYKYQMQLKDKTPMEMHTEITFNYNPPECFDSLLLAHFQYETPYLINECYLLEGIERMEALKFDVFESDYTTTLFLLAQTFGKMSNQNQMKHKSAKYCYWTLYRQLNAFKYDPVEWALNAATLSQYYVVEGIFKRARHCIAAAETVLKEAVCRPTPGPKETKEQMNNVKGDIEKNKSNDISTEDNKHNKLKEHQTIESEIGGDCNKTTEAILEESIDKMVAQIELNDLSKTNEKSENNQINTIDSGQDNNEVKLNSRKLLPDPMSESRLWDDDVYEEKRIQGEADIDRCWISYGLNLLEISFDRKMPDYNGPSEKDKFIIESKLPDFNLELAVIEREVTCEWIHMYEEARELFLFVQKKINSAREYYKLDFRCSDAIDLICDHSKAFKAISNFETSTDRKCIMHKKRIDMLSDLLKSLNQNYYQIQCRKMMLEVGEIYSTMMNLKLSLLETGPGSEDSIKLPSNAKGIVQKIRLLGKKGITVYEKFLESYRTPNGIIPDVFAEEDIRPVMIAHFYMARMHSKILEPDGNERLRNLVKSLEHYQFIVTYCNRHDNAAKQMSSELESCKDMTILLPRKIDKLRSEL